MRFSGSDPIHCSASSVDVELIKEKGWSMNLAASQHEAEEAPWSRDGWVWETAGTGATRTRRRQGSLFLTQQFSTTDTSPPGRSRAAGSAAREVDLDALVGAVAGGDAAALAALYDATAGKIVAITRAILRNVEDAEEVTGDVYTQAWQSAQRFDRSRGTALAWLQTIARSRSIDLLRQRRNQQRLFGPADAADEQAEERVEGNPETGLALFQNGTAVHGALARLSPLRRELLGLAFFRGMSHAEIAKTVSMPIGTVKTHVRQALRTLREALDGLEREA